MNRKQVSTSLPRSERVCPLALRHGALADPEYEGTGLWEAPRGPGRSPREGDVRLTEGAPESSLCPARTQRQGASREPTEDPQQKAAGRAASSSMSHTPLLFTAPLPGLWHFVTAAGAD